MGDQRTDRRQILVRRLAADDWEQARDARLAALAEAPYAFASTLARERGFDAEVWRSRAGSGWTVAAFDGAAIVGLATGIPAEHLPASERPSDRKPGDGEPGSGEPGSEQRAVNPPEWQLVGMWVAPGYRGQGVADALVGAVCDLAREASASSLTLWVTDVNDRARAFYRRLGFTATGARMLVRPEEPDNWEEELTLPLG
jgi:ribosomal protein S18 acetylase RimI-like enzyme